MGTIDGMKMAVAALVTALCVACDAAGSRSKWNRYQSNTTLDVGNYDVTYTLGGDKAAKYWVKFEGRRIAAASVATQPGERKIVSFTARVKGPIANGKGPFKEAPYPDCLNLTVITDGAEPPKPAITRNDAAPTIYLCGDSTVTDQQSEPWGSWGQCAPLMFGKGVAVANFARSGLTTETFWKQGRLAKICAHARKGDVVLVQFGHNDQKRDNLKPNADGGYERFLNRYIDEIRKTGADVVLITPVERLRYDETSGVQQPRTLEDYADAVKRVAAARGVPVIDLGAASYRVYGALGPDGAKKLFAKTDRTHHNIYGAMVMARFVMNELVNIHQEFKPFFNEKYAGFDPSNPPKEEYVPASGELDLTRPEGDGRDLQAEIDEIAKAGGGTLRLKAGTYKTGALFFKPGVNLHLEKGATILGTDEASGYPMRETRIEGETCEYYPALINADHCDGFTITGEGVIDGHGANTWEEFWRRRAEARKAGGDFRNKALMRPRVLYVSRSKNIDVSGVTFKNSKFWTTHFYDCEDVVVHDCSIVADVLKDSQGKELKGPSTDAIDIDKCRRFTARNVDIAVNDDGVAVKGGKGPWADDYGKFPGNGPSSDVLVENCTFRYPTHSALTLGSECPAATNVTMRNCTMDGCGNLINLKMRTDTPQHYAGVLVEGCKGKCRTFFRVQSWSQYHDGQGRTAPELMSFADGVTLRNNVVEAEKVKEVVWRNDVFRIANLVFDGNKVNGKDVE